MSKLSARAKSSKLTSGVNNNELHEIGVPKKESVLRQLKPKEHPRSYRLDSETINILKATLDRVNEISPKKVSEARLVKALMHLSSEIKEDKLFKALKDVW